MLTTIEPEYEQSAPLSATEDGRHVRPTDEHGNLIYRIPEANLASMTAKVEKLNKRAHRLGMAPIVVTEIGEDFATQRRRIEDPFGGPAEVQTPRIDGWDFAATIQHEDSGNLLRTCPGFDTLLPLQYRHADTHCEHCAKDRRRNNTYVLFNAETGTWKQVGRSCLADFLRTTSPQGVAEWATPKLDASQKQRVIAMVCGSPPEGRARWTVRLVAQEAVKRRLVPRVGRETIRVLLLDHDLKPWRDKNVVRGGTR